MAQPRKTHKPVAKWDFMVKRGPREALFLHAEDALKYHAAHLGSTLKVWNAARGGWQPWAQ